MKRILLTLALAAVLGGLVTGCSGLLTEKAHQNDLPVQMGIASTNDFSTVEWLRLAQVVNASANPSPSSLPIDTALGAVIAILASLGTYYQHRNTPPKP